MIHLYAISRQAVIPEGLVGIDGAELVTVVCGPLEAVVSEHAGVRPASDRASSLVHAAVVAALAENAPVLPMRFGLVHTDVPSLRGALRARAGELLGALDEAGGHVEFILKHTPYHRPSHSAMQEATGRIPGRPYLEARVLGERAARQADQVATAELRAASADLDAHAAVVLEHTGAGGAQRCYLVERAAISRFTAAARDCLAKRHELTLVGPWPPYTSLTEGFGT